MNEPGKSDKPVVPAKPGKTPNKENYWDFMERVVWAKGRGLAKENEEHDEDGADEQSSKPSRRAFLPVGPAKQVDRTQSRLEKRTAFAPVAARTWRWMHWRWESRQRR